MKKLHASGQPSPAQQGFSLIELMTVVGIIAVIASLALPRYKQFQAKAKAGESRNLLGSLYTLQNAYQVENNRWAVVAATGAVLTTTNTNSCPINDIGFRINPCDATAPVPRYQYSAVLNGTAGFYGYAVTGDAANNRVCSGNTAHHLRISETNTVVLISGATLSTAATPAATTIAAVCP